VAYTITSAFLHRLRTHLQHERTRKEALDLLGELDHADGLDSERLHELATWAREQARQGLDESAAGAGHKPLGEPRCSELRRNMAASARIIELSTDVLTALALDKLPAGAVLSLGREPPEDGELGCSSRSCDPLCDACKALEQVIERRDNGPTLRWPNADERAGMREAAEYIEAANSKPGERVRIVVGGDVPDDHADLLTREQVEALPSHDRVVLARIFAALLGDVRGDRHRLAMEALEAGGVEQVWDEIEAAREALADRLTGEWSDWPGIIRAAAGRNPHYSLPESHPLRQYQWAEWLGALIRREEPSECWSPNAERLAVLRAALARVEQLDVDGLDGLAFRVGSARAPVLQPDELALLRVACARVAIDSSGGAASRGQHRVPRVRGETVEVGS
jgi:hypothetical protein